MTAKRQQRPVAILCGGRGTRLNGSGPATPKALVEVGGKPIVWHVVQIYARQGFREFLLLTGFLGDLVERYARGESWPEGVSVRCHRSGDDTPTGGRVWAARELLAGRGFCLTYADGVADIDLARTLVEHERAGVLATVTAVRPRLQFGVLDLDERGRVRGFEEKPRSPRYVNGGFMVFESGALELFAADAVLERDVLPRLAAAGQLHASRHEGFWACLDTYKDRNQLDELCARGSPPWLDMRR
ncbi:NTP transferase domain-containing protein [Thermoleophilum album]|uniref:sugar phosphate nucleotidyltransferase n=1 Tax=Thermoleophilum album TaxID=29539 RepID=UPI00237C8211|nr:sugar phosphate nucleotidyltransferase [Thermoleophilum album]WDT92854.1 NTP transferase domain-containing protein [Thermoleophilum album]